MFTKKQIDNALSHLCKVQTLLGYEDDYKLLYDSFAIVLLHSGCHDFEPQPNFSAYDHVSAVWTWYVLVQICRDEPGEAEKGLESLRELVRQFKGPKFLTSKEVMDELELALAALEIAPVEPATPVPAP